MFEMRLLLCASCKRELFLRGWTLSSFVEAHDMKTLRPSEVCPTLHQQGKAIVKR